MSDQGIVILEYRIPLESRRIDAVLLVPGKVIVVEFKGKQAYLREDIDQAARYYRDLKAYHLTCSETCVACYLVPTGYEGQPIVDGVTKILGVRDLPGEILSCVIAGIGVPSVAEFLSSESYQPLPSLIDAARELFNTGSLGRVHQSAAETMPAVEACAGIIHRAAEKKRRALILVTGVPGAGKTLVGLQLAHAQYLSDLTVTRESGLKPTGPAVFLSGNGPLIEVLQYEIARAESGLSGKESVGSGSGGKAFVRDVHDYVRTYAADPSRVPPNHVLIYDEAQRAFDAVQVQKKQRGLDKSLIGLSEPELFIQFAERVPEWCVVVGLVGTGQEIHVGEEGGLQQWRAAIEKASDPDVWDVYYPETVATSGIFEGLNNTVVAPPLELNQTLRFHQANCLHQFVDELLNGNNAKARELSEKLKFQGYKLLMTHELDKAKSYLAGAYSDAPEARFGLLASSRDKDLGAYGIQKGFGSSGQVNRREYGPWYSDPKGAPAACTSFSKVVTEFGSQGLELDSALLAWGTDFLRQGNQWSNQFASRYENPGQVRDPHKLRINAYRVLLTRGRDGCVVFIPPISTGDKSMRETWRYLAACGFDQLTAD
ncbi:DNA/RNA helicase domain-containing protein [Marinobacter nauticus]|uniref:DNA/RNA helicase domain-containing protein n=1 Tax=Marinobacter nauticus TaxID=2743 RepID=UPI001C97A26F|nr:DNA/RNA helicase domain-containing protein [Marinobacter nauticus]MBY6102426.1 DUF2075 domain-containing protein [Marinobacter nauticus]